MSGVLTALSTTLNSSAMYELYGNVIPFVCGLAIIFLSIYVINKSIKSIKDEKVQM